MLSTQRRSLDIAENHGSTPAVLVPGNPSFISTAARTRTATPSCGICYIKAHNDSAAVGGCASVSGRFPGLSQVLRAQVRHELQGRRWTNVKSRPALRVSFAHQGRGEYAHLQACMGRRNSRLEEAVAEPGPGLTFNSLTRRYATDRLPAAPSAVSSMLVLG